MTKYRLSDCARLYLEALVDPWSCQGLPCIPDAVILPSYKFSVTSRGEFSTSAATGFGFIMIDPFQLVCNNITPILPGMANSAGETAFPYPNFPIVTTSQAYDQAFPDTRYNFDTSSFVRTGLTVSQGNSPYQIEAFAYNNWNFRLVGCGVKVVYAGSMFRNQGTMYIAKSQGNNNFDYSSTPGYFNLSDVASDQYTVIKRITNQGGYLYYTPDDPFFLAFSSMDDYVIRDCDARRTSKDPDNHHSLFIGVSGGDTDSPQTFHFEIKAFYEVIGRGLTLTKSHGDPTGQAKVLESLPNHAPAGTPAQTKAGIFTSLAQGIMDVSGPVAYNIGRAIPNIAMSAASSYFGGKSSAAQRLMLGPP